MKKILFLLLLLTGFTYSCDKDFGDLNTDKKNPAAVPPGPLFSYAQKELIDVMTTPNVNVGIFRLLSQYWTETTYTDEANYDLATRNIPQNFWNTIYPNVLNNLKECQRLIPAQDAVFFPKAVQDNQNACAEILNVYTYMVLVNTFGNVPYTQALDVNNIYPKYDDGKAIFDDLATRLDRAINSIDVSAGGFDVNDLLYGGDMAGWKTFGNTLKLYLGMMYAEVDAAKAKSMVEAAAPGAIQSNAENVAFHYLGAPPNTNPVWVDLIQSGRKDFVAANTIVDIMNGLSDPRVPLYFTTDAAGGYSGGIYAASNNYTTYSKPSDRVTAPDHESLFFDYAEVRFLLAEAVERGFSVGGTAAEHYEAGIRASIEYWGGSSADADTYLANPAVAYATAAGDWKTKIGNQKWIALYNRGFEGWTEWRRLDAPTLNVPDGLAYEDIPKRYTYPVQEQTLNAANYTSGASAVGGDNVKVRLFWDKQ
jgi:hypothetical protein